MCKGLVGRATKTAELDLVLQRQADLVYTTNKQKKGSRFWPRLVSLAPGCCVQKQTKNKKQKTKTKTLLNQILEKFQI